ncbi:MAG: hypothetical protein Ct9H300mP16_18290 [Pseudomonadota bacterium]|nr:MAG: hypothetical protein Ct9H300mP16_18290 [Pseudomonadota bacterium]
MIAFGQENVTTVAVLGSGLIGSGWAARFLAHGLDVQRGIRTRCRERTEGKCGTGLAAADRTRGI